MPFVEGESLRERLDREHELPVKDAVSIVTELSDALDYAHRQGVVHRDIKPANVLLLQGRPVISDFGIALAVGAAGGGRLTETGLSLGTPHYMSPEQATGDQAVGPAADLYALGCVFYEMLVGEPPYTGSTAQAVLGRILTADPDPVTAHRKAVPANVEAAISRALERLPADRFRSAAELGRALTDPGFRHGAGAAAAASQDTRRWKRAALATGLLALASLGTMGWLLAVRPEPAALAAHLQGRDEPESPVMMAVDVTPEAPFSAGRPVPLIDPWNFVTTNPARSYDVVADGSFIVSANPLRRRTEDGLAADVARRSAAVGVREIQVILNWFEALEGRMGGGSGGG